MKKLTYLYVMAVVIFGCNNSEDDGSGANGFGVTPDPPVGVLLVFPNQDSLCNEGENPTPTESTVFFEWAPNNNALNYRLTIENLNSGDISQYDTQDFIFPVTLERAVPFRWNVTYQLQGEVKQSAIWNFYNAGPGVQTYAPFPAEIIAPSMAQNIASTNSVTLNWNGNDLDDNIVAYDIFFGPNNPPELNTSDIVDTQLTVSVAPDNIYYWNVVTKDSAGNSSESGVYQFRILD